MEKFFLSTGPSEQKTIYKGLVKWLLSSGPPEQRTIEKGLVKWPPIGKNIRSKEKIIDHRLRDRTKDLPVGRRRIKYLVIIFPSF